MALSVLSQSSRSSQTPLSESPESLQSLPLPTKLEAPQTALTARTLDGLDFTLPVELEADRPPEARGLTRDAVRLLVSHYASLANQDEVQITHTNFRAIGEHLHAGDVLVLNTSGTMNAALQVHRADGTPLELHLSTHLPGDLWSVELRQPGEHGTLPFRATQAGETLDLPAGGTATLQLPYATDRSSSAGISSRLWLATFTLPAPLHVYLAQHGFPIRYGYVQHAWPSSYYQTVYATETGSAEMPSAGRAFTKELLQQLETHGVQVTQLLLHTGVSSLEDHEPPYEEQYQVPLATAQLVNAARAEGRRVIAVGTTVVRALETVTDTEGVVHPGAGWTSLIVTPERGIHAIDGLLTGLHEPRASHLAMLEALAGREHLRVAYAAALREGYLWHEFGDLHLILP